MTTYLEDLQLSVHAYNILARIGCVTREDVDEIITTGKIYSLIGCRKQDANEIISKHGFTFAPK